MTIFVVIAFFYIVGKIVSMFSAEEKEQRRKMEIERIKVEQKRVASEQARQAKEQERLAKEQQKQAEQIKKHEEMLLKLDERLATAEREIAFNKEQRERLYSLLKIEKLELSSAIGGSNTWQKHQRKVIALENQLHTVQKRLDKANAEKRFCKSKLEDVA